MARVERTIAVQLKGEIRDINAYCGAIGELANDYDVEIDIT